MFSVEERVEPTLRASGVAYCVRLARVFLILLYSVYRLTLCICCSYHAIHMHARATLRIRTVESNLTTSNTEDGVDQTKSP